MSDCASLPNPSNVDWHMKPSRAGYIWKILLPLFVKVMCNIDTNLKKTHCVCWSVNYRLLLLDLTANVFASTDTFSGCQVSPSYVSSFSCTASNFVNIQTCVIANRITELFCPVPLRESYFLSSLYCYHRCFLKTSIRHNALSDQS